MKIARLSPFIAVLLLGLLAGAWLGQGSFAPSAPIARADAPVPAKTPSAAPQVEDPKAVYAVPLETSPVRGSESALVTLVESSDFECPFCKRTAPTMKKIGETYGSKVRFSFKHNPLPMHPDAIPAAMLAEEARVQRGSDGFWAIHDKLMEMPSLDRASLEKAAQEAGLSIPEVRAALDGQRHLSRIRLDQALMTSLGARGTPTFFVNGRKVVGAQPFEAFKAVIDEELARADKQVRSGVAAKDVYARVVEKGARAPVMVDGPPPAARADVTATAVTVRPDDPARGSKAAPVTIVLFSDFQCPFCSKVGPTMKQVEQAYAGKVRIVWKHQPLSFHPKALPAAKAAEAARVQGKFWEMHDELFANQQALDEPAFAAAVKKLGLDEARFRKDAAATSTAARITEDQQQAGSVGATGTPTLFVNCRKSVGAKPFESLKPIIDEEIAKADAAVAKGEKIDAAFYERICAANVAAAPPVAAAKPTTNVVVALRPDDPAQGGARALVTVVEFSDFQCPFCSRAVPVLKELEKALGKDVRVVWKHLPLSFHPNAMPAAIAAEAAREQGKFWEMHDKLFADQAAHSPATYEKYAKELGLDLARFQASMKAPATRARVEADAAAAATAGVTGTPTFVVNGDVVVGAGALREAADRQLGKARLASK